jgi:hypothetical protein
MWDDDKVHPRDSSVPMLKLRLDTVRIGVVPNLTEGAPAAAAATAAAAAPGAGPSPSSAAAPLVEYRLHTAVLPLRVIVSYEVVAFFMGLADAAAAGGADEAAPTDEEDAPAPAGTFLQFVDIRPLRLNIDYEPSPVDRVALFGGDMKQLMNLVQRGGARACVCVCVYVCVCVCVCVYV